jgi:hypothetical protein
MMDFDRLRELFKGNEDALNLAADITSVVRIWDDLIDRDHDVPTDKINLAFWTTIVAIPANPFYRANYNTLAPLVRSSILGWLAGNELERGTNPHGHEISHILRYLAATIFVEFLFIIGGPKWAMVHGPEIWLMVKEEPFDAYLKELGHVPAST